MKALPNPSVALVAPDGRPTAVLMEIVPRLSAVDVLIDRQGCATPLFMARLGDVSRETVNPRVQLVNRDGTPTRVFTAMLAGLP